METSSDRLADVKERVAALRKDLPDVMDAFAQLQQAATAAGALDAKTKRLVMVGIALSQRCEHCIRVHVGAALELGATRADLFDTAAAAILMGGGPVAATVATVFPELLDVEPGPA
jgi:AhpD family alkylhydroperoxidase